MALDVGKITEFAAANLFPDNRRYFKLSHAEQSISVKRLFVNANVVILVFLLTSIVVILLSARFTFTRLGHPVNLILAIDISVATICSKLGASPKVRVSSLLSSRFTYSNWLFLDKSIAVILFLLTLIYPKSFAPFTSNSVTCWSASITKNLISSA